MRPNLKCPLRNEAASHAVRGTVYAALHSLEGMQ